MLITDIARCLGKKVDNKNFTSIRDEKTPSVKLYPQTNSFCDFGDGNLGGDMYETRINGRGMSKLKCLEEYKHLNLNKAAIRAITPSGFANAFYNANK